MASIVALLVAVAAAPVGAADGAKADDTRSTSGAKPAPPAVEAAEEPTVRHALQGLRALRSHQGRDCLEGEARAREPGTR